MHCLHGDKKLFWYNPSGPTKWIDISSACSSTPTETEIMVILFVLPVKEHEHSIQLYETNKQTKLNKFEQISTTINMKDPRWWWQNYSYTKKDKPWSYSHLLQKQTEVGWNGSWYLLQDLQKQWLFTV